MKAEFKVRELDNALLEISIPDFGSPKLRVDKAVVPLSQASKSKFNFVYHNTDCAILKEKAFWGAKYHLSVDGHRVKSDFMAHAHPLGKPSSRFMFIGCLMAIMLGLQSVLHDRGEEGTAVALYNFAFCCFGVVLVVIGLVKAGQEKRS